VLHQFDEEIPEILLLSKFHTNLTCQQG